MRGTLFVLALVFSVFAHGQNYRCVIPGEKAYFTNADYYLRGIRIDSTVTSGGTTIHYPYRSLRGNPEIGSSPLSIGGAWVGDKIAEYPDGSYLVTNTWNDTVVIKTQADVGAVWNFYTDTSAIYYRAEIISKSLELVDGIYDSVKTIELRAFHRDTGYIPSDPSNGLRLGISKSHGFYELFDLFMFPHRLVRDPGIVIVTTIDTIDAWFRYANQQQFRRTPFRTPTKMEMYDFEVGDVFQYAGDCASFLYYTCYNIMTDTCIAKEPLSSSSVKFTFARQTYQHMSGSGYPFPPTTITNTTYTIIADTTPFYIVPPGKMPEERNIDSILFYYPNDSKCVVSDAMKYAGGYLFNFFEPCGYVSTYKVGYGQTVHDFCDNPGGGGIDKQWKQVYSSRRGVICGTYIPIPTEVINIQTNSGFQIAPNPANDKLLLSFPSQTQLTFQLRNLFGKVVRSGGGVSPLQIDVCDLVSGTYVVSAQDINGIISRKMLTVVH